MKRLAVIAAAITSVLWMTSSASAQYPPPENVPVVSVSDPTPPVNSTVTITWAIRGPSTALPPESTGSRLLNISFEVAQTPACAPAIVTQPGNDASVRFVRETLNAAGSGVGEGELKTGSTPGRIVVRVTCTNGNTADIAVTVEGATSQNPPAQGPAQNAPAQSGGAGSPSGVTPRPPSTGSGGIAATSSIAVLLALVAAASAVAGARLVTRKR